MFLHEANGERGGPILQRRSAALLLLFGLRRVALQFIRCDIGMLAVEVIRKLDRAD